MAMAVTDLGESMLLLSTALVASGWFWISRQRRLAAAWLFCMGGCAGTMMALKLGFLACGHLVFAGTVHTPSGHSAMAALFYGAAALTVTRGAPALTRYSLLIRGVGAAVALAVGASRIVVSAHTPQEVVFGLSVGFAWLGVFALMQPKAYTLPRPSATVLCVFGLVYGGLLTGTLSGQHMSLELLLFHYARVLSLKWDVCVV
jgi:hypothetical protein